MQRLRDRTPAGAAAQKPAARGKTNGKGKAPAVERYVALLRGINVGGNNLVKMADLRASFESMGFGDVATYIQSGNVVFSSKRGNRTRLVAQIEKTLRATFGCGAPVAVISAAELALVVDRAPAGFGTQPGRYRYDVLFVMPPTSPASALAQLSIKPGVDSAHAGQHAVYFRRLISKAAQSHLTKLVQLPLYKSVTVRNWNTTTRLLDLVSREPAAEPPRAARPRRRP